MTTRTKTDVSTTHRKKLSPRKRLRIWEKFGGVCQGPCGRKLSPSDKWIAEHPRALGLGGPDDIDGLELWCDWCAATKTHDEDMPRIVKAKRQKLAHIGAKESRNPMPGGRKSKWKKKMNGQVVLRDR